MTLEKNALKVLALEPYYSGSHRYFLEGWSSRSCHTWTKLVLPGRKWRWRMRHSALEFAQQISEWPYSRTNWDIIFTSSMLDLAGFRGLLPSHLQRIPAVVYFHENQLTYPVHQESLRDYHLVFNHLTSAQAASAIWFNSRYHLEDFLVNLPRFLRRMPDYRPLNLVEEIRAKSQVHPQGIDLFPDRPVRRPGPLRIIWVARWEYDKDPESFFGALEILQNRGIPFELAVIGGKENKNTMPCFSRARRRFQQQLRFWGFVRDRQEYGRILSWADVAVSTAQHEFFGIAILEAAAAGCFPLVPRRLAYPEIFGPGEKKGLISFFYSGQVSDLAASLEKLASLDDIWEGHPDRVLKLARCYSWEQQVPLWDQGLSRVAKNAVRG